MSIDWNEYWLQSSGDPEQDKTFGIKDYSAKSFMYM